mgnify:CR=1 FL=1
MLSLFFIPLSLKKRHSIVIWERRPLLLSKKEVSFYWVNLGGGLRSIFVAMSQTILAFGSSLILWSML